MATRVLFIGGPEDRMTKLIPDRPSILAFREFFNGFFPDAVEDDDSEYIVSEDHEYHLIAEDIAEGVAVYRHSSITTGQALPRLIEAYEEPYKGDEPL